MICRFKLIETPGLQGILFGACKQVGSKNGNIVF